MATDSYFVSGPGCGIGVKFVRKPPPPFIIQTGMNIPTSPESLAALRRLRKEATSRGDHCLGVILAGVELYVSLGREFELLEVMKTFADEMKGPVENTPTAAELKRLYEWDPETDPQKQA